MIKLLTLFLLINYVLSQSAACSEFSSSACTSSGYCYWTGSSCITAECHKVTDVSACRQTGVPATNGYLAAINKCFEIPSIDSNFLNQCMEQGQTTMMHAYVRFPIDLTQLYSSKTVNGYLVTTIMTAKYTSQYKNEILTVNILTATTGELLNIMNAYVQMQYDLADSAINQNYIEKAIYESMQAIRDDVQLTLTGTTNKRQDYYTVLWRMTDAYFLKLRSNLSFYISNKQLINFGFSNFDRLSLTLTSQLQSTQITWTSYIQNGYLELLIIPAEYFGILTSLSDVIIIRPSKFDGNDSALSFTLIWSWQYTGITPQSSSSLYTFDKIQMNGFSLAKPAGCNTSTKTCTLTISNQSTSIAYFIADSSTFSQTASGRYYTSCRLGGFTWDGSTCS